MSKWVMRGTSYWWWVAAFVLCWTISKAQWFQGQKLSGSWTVEWVCWCWMLQVYGGDSVKSVLPSPYQAMVMPGQYQYMARNISPLYAYSCLNSMFLHQELISYRYSSCSSSSFPIMHIPQSWVMSSSRSCWSQKPNALLFQIGSGWNLAALFFK